MEHTPAKVTTQPDDGRGVPGIWISDPDPIEKSLVDDAVKMAKMARDLLNGPGPMGSSELRYLATSLLRSLVDVLDVLGADRG